MKFKFFILLCLFSCHSDIPKLNMVLYNQSEATIKKYLAGTWNLDYTTGSIAGNRTNYSNTKFKFQFGSVDHVTWTESSKVIIDSDLIWTKLKWSQSDSIYCLRYTNGPSDFYPVEIKEGVLCLTEVCCDGYIYYLTR